MCHRSVSQECLSASRFSKCQHITGRLDVNCRDFERRCRGTGPEDGTRSNRPSCCAWAKHRPRKLGAGWLSSVGNGRPRPLPSSLVVLRADPVTMATREVFLAVYDLSSGLAAQLSKSLLGKQVLLDSLDCASSIKASNISNRPLRHIYKRRGLTEARRRPNFSVRLLFDVLSASVFGLLASSQHFLSLVHSLFPIFVSRNNRPSFHLSTDSCIIHCVQTPCTFHFIFFFVLVPYTSITSAFLSNVTSHIIIQTYVLTCAEGLPRGCCTIDESYFERVWATKPKIARNYHSCTGCALCVCRKYVSCEEIAAYTVLGKQNMVESDCFNQSSASISLIGTLCAGQWSLAHRYHF